MLKPPRSEIRAQVDAHGLLDLGKYGRIERSLADWKFGAVSDDDRDLAAARQFRNRHRLTGPRVERSNHVGKCGDSLAIDVGGHVFVVDAEHCLAPRSTH